MQTPNATPATSTAQTHGMQFAQTVRTTSTQGAIANGASGQAGLTTLPAGIVANSPGHSYPTASLVAGRAYRAGAMQMYNALMLLASATVPMRYPAMVVHAKGMGLALTQHNSWASLTDLGDIGAAMVVTQGQAKGYVITDKGRAMLAANAVATAKYGQPAFVCPFNGAVVACNKANSLLAGQAASLTITAGPNGTTVTTVNLAMPVAPNYGAVAGPIGLTPGSLAPVAPVTPAIVAPGKPGKPGKGKASK